MDLEDIAVPASEDYIEVEDTTVQNARSAMSDFQAACDLLGDCIDEEEKEIKIEDPLTFIPDSVAEFEALRQTVASKVEKLSNEEKLIFLENFLSRATEKVPSFIVEDISKSIK